MEGLDTGGAMGEHRTDRRDRRLQIPSREQYHAPGPDADVAGHDRNVVGGATPAVAPGMGQLARIGSRAEVDERCSGVVHVSTPAL
jgi:hypothetical protein